MRKFIFILGLVFGLNFSTILHAEELSVDELVVTGSRTLSSSALTTPFPMDFLSGQVLADTAHVETGRALQVLVPSFNFPSTAIADGTDSLKPATLRGLGPDQTLVLVNGLRRHKSALLHVNQSVGRGTAGTDMNAIAPSFVGAIEVLRDGAAALYGSDAIAGVINIRLREDTGGELLTSYGATSRGDGEQARAALNYGVRLGQSGFLFMGYDITEHNSTDRSGLTGSLLYSPPAGTSDAASCNANDNSGCDPREASVSRNVFNIGDPETLHKNWLVNAGLTTGAIEWRGFLLASDRDNLSNGFFREPDDSGRNIIAIYPDGFLPEINTDIADFAAQLSAATQWRGWDIKLAGVRGENEFDFTVTNSLNASFGDDSRTRAYSGGLVYGEDSVNLAANGELASFALALGAEWRRENYQIRAGELYSYADCNMLDAATLTALGDDGRCEQRATGIQVFRGFSPENARDESRETLGLYAETSRQFRNIHATAALRWEANDGFDDAISGRLGARYEATPRHALRASVSNGFRAPSLHQLHFNNISTQADGAGVLRESGTFTNDSALVRALGVPSLKQETSINYSIGYVLTPAAGFTLTLDAYQIDIDDRIVISEQLDRDSLATNMAAADIVAVLNAQGITRAQFFLNGPDTRTRGVELVADWAPDFKLKGDVSFRLASHYARTRTRSGFAALDSLAGSLLGGLDAREIFGDYERAVIEDWQPAHRSSLSANYFLGRFTLSSTITHYGTYTVRERVGGNLNSQRFGNEIVVDMRAVLNLNENSSITIYGDNIFDNYPDKNNIAVARGGTIDGIVDSPNGVFQYSRRTAPFGFNGSYFGVQFKHSF